MALTDKLTAIANAIRAKTGKTESLTLDQMPTEIESITTGGGSSDDVRYVTFRNEATGEEFVKPVATGDDCVDVVAKGLWAKPTKPSDAQYDYTFYGWGASDGGAADSTILQNITEDKTVYAIFTATVKYYTITYYDEDGATVLKTESLAYGAMPSYTPAKDGFAFDKWTPTPAAVTGDASYIAAWVEVIGGSCGDDVSWVYDSEAKTLTISGAGAMTNFTSKVAQPWADYRSDITEIVINEGVTTIGNYAFQDFTGIEGIYLPDSVESIGRYSFSGCTNAQWASFGNGLMTIDTYALKNSGALRSAGHIAHRTASATTWKNDTTTKTITTRSWNWSYGLTGMEGLSSIASDANCAYKWTRS